MVESPALRQALSQIEGREKELSEITEDNFDKQMSLFDQVLMEFGAASSAATQELDSEVKAAGANASEESIQRQAHLQFIQAYLDAKR